MSDIVCRVWGLAEWRIAYACPCVGFGETTRRDAWWLQPLAVVSRVVRLHHLFDVGGLSERRITEFGPYLSPMFSPLLFGPSPHSLVRRPGDPDVVAAVPALLGGGADSLGARSASGSPATTTAAPTTRRSGPIRRAAPSASRARNTSASDRSRSSSRTSTATSCTSRSSSSSSSPTTRGRRCGFRSARRAGAGAPTEFGIGVGTLVLTAERRVPRLLHVRLPLAAAPGRRRARRDVRPARRARPRTRA